MVRIHGGSPLSDVITEYTGELCYYTAIEIQNMIKIG